MSVPFSAAQGLIIVRVRLWGPGGGVRVQLALDTGATATVVNRRAAVLAGYDPGRSSEQVRVTTASGVEDVPRIAIEAIDALEQTRHNFSVLCHTLPPSASVDGVLGLDFLRGTRLIVDFRAGLVSLE